MKKQSGLLRRLTVLALALCMLAALTTEIFAVKNATYSTSAGTKSTNKQISVGTHIALGKRNNNTISWQVVKLANDNTAILFCDYIMDIVGYGPTSSYSYIGSAMEAWCQTFIGGNSFDEDERKLFISGTVTEILSAQRDAAVVTAEIACMQDSGARVICAFYDADGRLLHTVIQPLQSGKNSLSFTTSDANAACAKLFVLDAKNAPAAAGKTVQLNS